jgi:Fe-S cluster biosynthesis and repair protein YggX
VKFGRDLPGLDRIPWKGEIGKRVYENISKDAWKMWLEHSKMVMNEYRLNPLDPNSQKIMEEQMEQFFFGEGAKLPEGYVQKGQRVKIAGAEAIQKTSAARERACYFQHGVLPAFSFLSPPPLSRILGADVPPAIGRQPKFTSGALTQHRFHPPNPPAQK